MRLSRPVSQSVSARRPLFRPAPVALLGLALLVLLPSGPGQGSAGAAGPRALSLRERVEARRAIEAVLWAHRLWPEDNAGTKPTLDAWLKPGTLEREIEDDLRKSDALARRWGRPITSEALQAELDRMTRDSQSPRVLREILDALHGDAFLAAEVLARHALADRLVRSAYAWDGRIHQETAGRAAKSLERARNLAALERAGDAFAQTRLRRGPGNDNPHGLGTPIYVEQLSDDEWRDRVALLGKSAGVEGATRDILARLPIGEPGPLQEGEHEFTGTAVASASSDQVLLARAVWHKRPFDDWWAGERERFSADPSVPAAEYTLAPLAPPGNPCTNDTWYPIKRTVPSPRMEAATVWTGTEMIVWGGFSGSAALGDGGRYRPDIDSWTPMSANNAPSARRRMAVVWTGTEMIVWGGDNGAATPVPLATGGRYNPVTDTWSTPVQLAFPTARTYPTGVWTGSEMIIWGGVGASGTLPQTGGRYDPAANNWTATTTTGAPAGRFGHTATWFNNEMVVWGGDAITIFLGTGARYNPATDQWAAMTNSGSPGQRAYHTAVVFAGRLLIWGGQRAVNDAFATGAFYLQDSWSALSTAGAPPGARLNHSAVVVDNPNAPGNYRMVIFGGQGVNISGNFFERNDGSVFRQFQNDWFAINLFGGPSQRHFHSAVSTGRGTMIVWGGANGTNALGDGRIYDPFGDVWSGMSNAGTPGPVPAPRTSHTLTWTGSEAVVWGGSTATGLATTHGSYNPATDAWSAINQAGAPSPVGGHTAVWTGTHVLVWGGSTPSGDTNGGGAFDLSGWSPIDTTGAPAPRHGHTAVWGANTMTVWGGINASSQPIGDGGRYTFTTFVQEWTSPMAPSPLAARGLHTAVWTGSRMLVFGGAGTISFYNDGASYNVVGNTWTSLASLNAPPSRYRHRAVWTGTEMIVYGGYNGNILGDGGLYNPTLDSWQALPAPPIDVRDDLTATWTGSEMIVWGGRKTFGLNGDGARYNAGFHGWTPMTNVGAPSSRWQAPGVQAGSEMIVWGGSDLNGVTDTGGRYCASCADLSTFEAATDIRFTDSTNMVWTGSPGVSSYGLYRGTLGAGGPAYNHACFVAGLGSPAAGDASTPGVGTAWYYLVGAKNACSGTSLGRASNGTPRPNAAPCP